MHGAPGQQQQHPQQLLLLLVVVVVVHLGLPAPLLLLLLGAVGREGMEGRRC
jgi:hypothetical protein